MIINGFIPSGTRDRSAFMNNILGIMTHRVNNPGSFRRHAKSALAEKFNGVMVFTPHDVSLDRKQIRGYLFQDGKWTKKTTAFPKINMDIGFYTSAAVQRASIVKRSKTFEFTGYGLGNKCKIQNHLLESTLLKPYLLPTEQVKNEQQFIKFLYKHGSIMLKPINGWGGRGIIRVTRDKEQFIVQRNDVASLRLPVSQLSSYLRKVLRNGRHLMQKWIDIRNKNGNVYDIRVLVQKNGEGNWQTTGMAVREAKKDKITSNIKSGGRAYDVDGYMSKEFGKDKGEALTKSIAEVGDHIPEFVEKSYQSRLSELGIDLAVDASGRLWLLEINIKPGKEVIKQVYGKKAWEKSLHNHFQYARNLLEKS